MRQKLHYLDRVNVVHLTSIASVLVASGKGVADGSRR